MGIIRKQAIQGTIYTYLGAALGFVNISILFPRILGQDQVGLLGVIVAYSVIFSQFASLGFNATTTRLFSYFRTDDKRHHGFAFLLLMVSLVGFILSLIVFLFIKPVLLNDTDPESSGLMQQYFWYIVPLIFFTLFFNAFDNYYKMLFRSVPGTFMKELLIRIFVFIIILVYSLGLISFSMFVFLYVASYCLPTIIILVMLAIDGQLKIKPDFSFIDRQMRKDLINVSLFGIITSATGILTLNIDRVMIEEILGLSDTGVYTIAYFFGTIIILPSRPLVKISSAIVAEAWKSNDTGSISNIYYKSCINQFVIGAFLTAAIWLNIDNIIQIMTEEYSEGKFVILFIALAYLSDMASGVGSGILMTSHKYRMQALFMGIMVVMIVITNLLFIPVYGIVGAALASFISKTLYNLMRYIYMWVKFRMQPYDYKSLLVIGITALSFFTAYLIPVFENFILDILIRSADFGIIFIGMTYILNISDDINNRLETYYKLVKTGFRKDQR
ncbi:MAG: oligosaccharide flippase family protein [Bacteroidota bacterium]